MGEQLGRPEDGSPTLVRGRVTDPAGAPLDGASLDVWQSSSNGLYDTQDPQQPPFNLRGVFVTGPDGAYHFRTVRPVSYPIPTDGPVGDLLRGAGRHNWRAAHIHAIVSAPGHRPVTTHIFDAENPYLDSDTVFGVKDSLVRPFRPGRPRRPVRRQLRHRDGLLPGRPGRRLGAYRGFWPAKPLKTDVIMTQIR